MTRSLLFLLTLTSPLLAAEPVAGKPIRPKSFGIIFNMGYARDALPKDKALLKTLAKSLKEAHYNVVLCKYDDTRAEVFKEVGLRIFVDLLAPDHHVYKNVEGAKTLCTSLRGQDVVWGYHLWSDRIGGTINGRSRDVKNVHTWDPTHPTYIGNYHARALTELKNPDLVGYYDFHWKRGGLWKYLHRVTQATKKSDAFFMRYTASDPGRVGKGNYNRVLYTITTSLAFGMKGYLYHYRGGMINPKTGKWNALGKDLARVNEQVAPLGPELLKLGNPLAVYSTTITKTAKDRPTGKEAPTLPDASLKPIPKDFAIQVTSGEALLGDFRDGKKQVIYFSNHNAYQPQNMKLKTSVNSVEHFDRTKKQWQKLTLKNGMVEFVIPPACAELIRLHGKAEPRP